MEKIKGIDLAEIGHKKVIQGIVLGDEEDNYLLMLPEEQLVFNPTRIHHHFDLTTSDWEKLLRQLDLMEVEVTQGGKLPKVVLRKCQRNIDQSVAWEVYRRDNFTCRYCGVDKVPMTVDHLRTWEEGGPTIVKNLLCSCKKCNRARGNMPYEEWLESDYYQKVSKNLSNSIRIHNFELVKEIEDIPLMKHKRRR